MATNNNNNNQPDKKKGFWDDFTWFDRPGKRGFLSSVGRGMSGFAAGWVNPASAYQMWRDEQQDPQKQLTNLLMAKILGGESATTQAPTATGAMPGATNLPTTLPNSQQLRLMYKPTGFAIDPRDEAKLDIWKKGQTKEVDWQAELKKSKMTSTYNLDLVTQHMYDLSDWLVEAYKEGGAGSRWKEIAAELSTEGWLGETAAEHFASSSAIPGKVTEILGKMFPMLTQQIGRPGSVRLLSSVFDRLARTLPKLRTAPLNARNMMAASIESYFRITRALNKVGTLPNTEGMNPQQLESFATKIESMAKNIKLSKEEQKALKLLQSTAMKKIDTYIKGRGKGKEAGRTITLPSGKKITIGAQ